MSAQDRLDQIKLELIDNGQVSVSGLSERLGVTEETVRRDLTRLENDGLLKRTYGGAILLQRKQEADTNFTKRAGLHKPEKRYIAQKVLALIDGMSAIAIDSSTTAMEAAKAFADRDAVTLLTNSTAAFQELSDSRLTIVSSGGEFDKVTMSLRGQAAKRVLEQYRVDATLFSCKGFDESGAYDSRESESDVKRVLLDMGAKRIMLADHSKFRRAAFVKLIELDRIDYLVTDRDPSEEWKDICEQHGIQLIF